jgi:hypothetical protein
MEERWLTYDDPVMMLGLLGAHKSGRKVSLFCAACCRAVRADEPALQGPILDATERYVDGAGEVDEITRAARNYDSDTCPVRLLASLFETREDGPPAPLLAVAAEVVGLAGSFNVGTARQPHARLGAKIARTLRAQSHLLRDIFGNPYRAVKVQPAWLTSDVVALARGIYEEKAFDRMPILADALQDAGCANEDVLAHCRDVSATHVRGCWVVDLLLGKT